MRGYTVALKTVLETCNFEMLSEFGVYSISWDTFCIYIWKCFENRISKSFENWFWKMKFWKVLQIDWKWSLKSIENW